MYAGRVVTEEMLTECEHLEQVKKANINLKSHLLEGRQQK